MNGFILFCEETIIENMIPRAISKAWMKVTLGQKKIPKDINVTNVIGQTKQYLYKRLLKLIKSPSSRIN